MTFEDLDLDQARRQLAPNAVLKAGINMANPLLVAGRDAGGKPTGIAPDLATEIARELGVECQLCEFPRPGETADAVHECGIVLIAIEPQRAQTILFSPGYVEIEATYLVRPGRSIVSTREADQQGTKIVVSERSAYDLWLTRNIRHAEIIRITGLEAAFNHFKDGHGDLLAGLRPALAVQARSLPGATLLADSFSAVQQAVGTAKTHDIGAAFLRRFVEQTRADGRVKAIIDKHGVEGLTISTG